VNLSVFINAFRTVDVRKKLLFTLAMVVVYRLGATTPTPGVDFAAVNKCVSFVKGSDLLGIVNLFSGGALLKLSVFALGIMPYITASIILQLLTVVIPRLERLKDEGQAGQAKITQYTRYLTIGLAVLQSTGIIALARTPGRLLNGCPEQLIPNQSVFTILTMVICMTAGTAVVMWLGEMITERGVGNGMSILIFTSIISALPGQFAAVVTLHGWFAFAAVCVIGIALIVAVVFVEQAQRRIPVQYAKRMVGRKMYGGTSTYIPLKVNMAGVIPVIFASSLLYIPVLVAQLSGSTAGWAQWVNTTFSRGDHWVYLVTYFALIVFFSFFYAEITFDPYQVADNTKKYGGFIPGIRPGKPTAEYLNYVLTRLEGAGSLYLATIATLPFIGFGFLGVTNQFIFGGTSLLIVVGVGLDTVKQIESQLQQRSYEGFLR
jgi:preprotein translocase subunit SecY